MDKRVFYSDEFLAWLIYRRKGYIPHPERYIINKRVVELVIEICMMNGNAHVWDKDTDWVWFFKKYGHLYTMKLNRPDVVYTGVLPFVNNTKFLKKYHRTDKVIYAYYVVSYIQDYITTHKPPHWGSTSTDMQLYTDTVKWVRDILETAGELNEKYTTRYREFLADDWYPDKTTEDFPWADYWLMGGTEFDPSKIHDYDAREHLLTYLEATILTYPTIRDTRVVGSAIKNAMDELPIGSAAKKILRLYVNQVCVNGNNIPLLEYISPSCDIYQRIMAGYKSNDPCARTTNFSRIMEAYHGGSVPDGIIDEFIKYGDIDSMPVTTMYMALTLPRMTNIIMRPDGAEQLKSMLLRDDATVRWLESNLGSIPMVPSAMMNIINGCIQAMETHAADVDGNLTLYEINHCRRVIMDIIRSDPYTWIESIPEIMRVCYIDPVAMLQVHRVSTKVDRKRYYESVPLRSVTSSVLTTGMMYADFIKFDLRQYSTANPNTKLIGIETVFSSVDEMSRFIVSGKKECYLMDIDNVDIEIAIAKITDFEYGDHRSWLTKVRESILFSCNKKK